MTPGSHLAVGRRQSRPDVIGSEPEKSNRRGQIIGKLTTIGFDADDTLWDHEQYYQAVQAGFASLLSDYAEPGHLAERLMEAEMRNLGHYGFGVKGFTLSMIETAADVIGGEVPGRVLREILRTGRDLLMHPIIPLPHARDCLSALSRDYRLVLITKGELLDQERKLAASGLGDFFNAVEIVSDKTRATYETAFLRHGDGPARAVMVGNSLKSDVIPALDAGSWAVHVPSTANWALDHAEPPAANGRWFRLADLSGLPPLLQDLARS